MCYMDTMMKKLYTFLKILNNQLLLIYYFVINVIKKNK